MATSETLEQLVSRVCEQNYVGCLHFSGQLRSQNAVMMDGINPLKQKLVTAIKEYLANNFRGLVFDEPNEQEMRAYNSGFADSQLVVPTGKPVNEACDKGHIEGLKTGTVIQKDKLKAEKETSYNTGYSTGHADGQLGERNWWKQAIGFVNTGQTGGLTPPYSQQAAAIKDLATVCERRGWVSAFCSIKKAVTSIEGEKT